MKKTDYLVIGAGSAGLTAAIGLHKLGKEVTLVAKQIGGECTHTGCIPSKKLLQLADIYYSSPSNNKPFEPGSVFTTINKTIAKVEAEEKIALKNIPTILGTVQFKDEKTVTIAPNKTPKKSIELQFNKKAIIATGSQPRTIPIAGVNNQQILTNNSIFNLKKIPSRLYIIGGGAIAVEMATAFAKLGSRVTMIVRSSLLKNYPQQHRAILKKSLTKIGVKIHENITLSQFKNNKLHTNIKQTFPFSQNDYILQATGRKPTIGQLHLEAAGIKSTKKGIEIDFNYTTTNKKVKAIGDCIANPRFTHTAYFEAKQLVTNEIIPFSAKQPQLISHQLFCDPHIGQVGQTVSKNLIEAIPIELKDSDTGILHEDTTSHLLLFVHMLTGRIVGASIIGPATDSLLPVLTLACHQKTSLWKLANTIFAYPTYAFSLSTLAGSFTSKYIKELPKNIRKWLGLNANRVFAVSIWLVTALFILWYLQQKNFELMIILNDLRNVFLSPWGALVYIALYAVRPLVLLPATLLTISGGAFFGLTYGTLLTILASNLSAAVAFLLGKTVFGKDISDEAAIPSLQQKLRDNTFLATVTARLAALPYDLVSYAAGASNVKFWPFIIANALSILPGTIAYVSIGASSNSLVTDGTGFNPIPLIFGVALFVASIFGNKYIKKWLQRTR